MWAEQKATYLLSETRIFRSNGECFAAETTSVPFFSGDKWSALTVFRDIDERKKTQEEAKRYVERLSQMNKDLSQFTYSISHDLKEPLRMVISFLALLSEEMEEHKVEEEQFRLYLGFAKDGALRMGAMLNALLTFLKTGTQEMKLVRYNAGESVQEAIANLQLLIDENAAEIQCDEMPEVEAERSQLTQVFQNLIGNAIKYRQKEVVVTVTISVSDDSDGWRFCVKDNGIGIGEKNIERIFQLFTRLHPRKDYEGLGIGLATCKRIVERHCGQIWVESEKGVGSRFCFTLPKPKKKGNENRGSTV